MKRRSASPTLRCSSSSKPPAHCRRCGATPFLQAVARRLSGIANPTNDDVSAATIAVLGGLGVDPPFLCDAAPTEEADHGPT